MLYAGLALALVASAMYAAAPSRRCAGPPPIVSSSALPFGYTRISCGVSGQPRRRRWRKFARGDEPRWTRRFGSWLADGRRLKDVIRQLTEEETEISYKRRILHGKIDILRAELVNRLRNKHEGGK